MTNVTVFDRMVTPPVYDLANVGFTVMAQRQLKLEADIQLYELFKQLLWWKSSSLGFNVPFGNDCLFVNFRKHSFFL